MGRLYFRTLWPSGIARMAILCPRGIGSSTLTVPTGLPSSVTALASWPGWRSTTATATSSCSSCMRTLWGIVFSPCNEMSGSVFCKKYMKDGLVCQLNFVAAASAFPLWTAHPGCTPPFGARLPDVWGACRCPAPGSEWHLRQRDQEDDVEDHVETGDDGHADQRIGQGALQGPGLEHGEDHQCGENADARRQEAYIGHDEGADQHQRHQPDPPGGRSHHGGRFLVRVRFEQIPHDEPDGEADHQGADRRREHIRIGVHQGSRVVQEDSGDQNEDGGQNDAWRIVFTFRGHFAVPLSVSSAGQ